VFGFVDNKAHDDKTGAKTGLYVRVMKRRGRTYYYWAQKETDPMTGRWVERTLRRLTEEEVAKHVGRTSAKAEDENAGAKTSITRAEAQGTLAEDVAKTELPLIVSEQELEAPASSAHGQKAEEPPNETAKTEVVDTPQKNQADVETEREAPMAETSMDAAPAAETGVMAKTESSLVTIGQGMEGVLAEVHSPQPEGTLENKARTTKKTGTAETATSQTQGHKATASEDLAKTSPTQTHDEPAERIGLSAHAETACFEIQKESQQAINENPRNDSADEEWLLRVFGYRVDDHGFVPSVGRLYKLVPTIAGGKVGHVLIAYNGDITCACGSRQGSECEHIQAVRRARIDP